VPFKNNFFINLKKIHSKYVRKWVKILVLLTFNNDDRKTLSKSDDVMKNEDLQGIVVARKLLLAVENVVSAS